ncbi:MAG: hypothetical protein KatS3mg050_4782 [Litorilinea sp.]|nr:MAG: hypothetical protein KatS3mg050_4782 [Litorilinea sp.]
MFSLPEWAPNVHPLIVHFPIALLATAALFDLLSLVPPGRPGVRKVAVSLYTLGALALAVAFYTGRAAADGLDLPAQIIPHVTDHADWAERTLWFFGLYAGVRLLALWFEVKGKYRVPRWIPLLLFLAGTAGYYLVVETGDHGARLVYAYGVGVQPDVEQAEENIEEPAPAAPSDTVARVEVQPDGSWTWQPGPGAPRVLTETFRFLLGSPADLLPVVSDSGLVLQSTGRPVLFVLDRPLGSLQAEASLDLRAFKGRFRLVHHLQDARNYDFLEVADGRLLQGRVQEGTAETFDAAPAPADGPLVLKVVSDGTHFRGYARGEMATHGHGSTPAPGPVGLFVEGTGPLVLHRLGVQALRPQTH